MCPSSAGFGFLSFLSSWFMRSGLAACSGAEGQVGNARNLRFEALALGHVGP